VCHLLQVMTKPLVEGHNEPLLGAIQDLHGQEVGHRPLEKTLFFRPRILSDGGKEAANSINGWSRKGQRISTELAIEVMSTLTSRSFGR